MNRLTVLKDMTGAGISLPCGKGGVIEQDINTEKEE